MQATSKHRPLNILLAFDGSQHSLAAIDLLRDMPLMEKSNVSIVGVLIPRDSSNHAILEAALDQADEILKEKGLNSKTELIVGNPAENIIQFAEKNHPDLIVAGAKGLRHTLGILLGGVAQQIVEYAREPVLVVRAPYRGLNRLLFVTDGSSSSQKALEYLAGADYTASQEADLPSTYEHFPLPTGTEVHVMHVLPPPPSPDLIARSWPIGPDILPPIPLDQDAERGWLKEEEDIGKSLLEQTKKYLNARSGRKIHTVLLRGDAATEIIQYVKDNQIDLILAGSRGLSEMRSWLLGSVSRKLVHYANCSVMVVKGPYTEA